MQAVESATQAPGAPGLAPRWTSSSKHGVGAARNLESRVWFTLGRGIVTEIYYPRVDRACTRDWQFLVTDGHEFFSEEKRDTFFEIDYLADGVPAFRISNTHCRRRYRIDKQVLADPYRHSVLQQVRFVPLKGDLAAYQLYSLLAPHLDNCGSDNSAFVGEYKGMPMLFAHRNGVALALACSAPWSARSVGFVGVSDGWQQLFRDKTLRQTWARADGGNVALTGQIDLAACDGRFLAVVAFGRSPTEAGFRARATLEDGYEAAWERYQAEWERWQQSLACLEDGDTRSPNRYRVSLAVLGAHESKDFPGGTIASLSIPWGTIHGDDDLGGYHLVWSRDLYEAAGGLLAAGATDQACRSLRYFRTTQEAGHWPQNMWLDGTAYWNGVQLDETAAPILLAELSHREGAIDTGQLSRLWPMIRAAASYILLNGPSTEQDRWEENAGYTPFTIAMEVAALLVAADHADTHGESQLAVFLRQTADAWNENIERWTYARDTDLARRFGVDGYYVRIAPARVAPGRSPLDGTVAIRNRADHWEPPATDVISTDALALVRFGLRDPHDPRILNTLRLIDATLKVDLPQGPCWHRYTGDGYGETAEGKPYDGVGVGRAWPLLTGERAHYELAAGRLEEARRLLRALESFGNSSGLIPEQVWDSPDIPRRFLFSGRPSGSACPLVWAHAEHVKLIRSLRDGRVFDMPPHTAQRYLRDHTPARHYPWRFIAQCGSIPRERILRLELNAPAVARWSLDSWATSADQPSRDSTLGIHYIDLPTDRAPSGAQVQFTFYWPGADRWEGRNFTATIE